MLRLTVIVLIFNLVPSVGEAVEMVVHRVAEGHWAHSEEHGDSLPGSGEHGCSPTAHLCRCCPSLTMEPAAVLAVGPVRAGFTGRAPRHAGAALDAWTHPPFQPPIA